MVFKPICVDLYQGDDVSDSPSPLAGFDQVAGDGIPFVIHKASEGLYGTDSRYAARREKWMGGAAVTLTDVDGKAVTLPRAWGAYHFFHGASEATAIQEAKQFLSAAKLESGDEAFLDWEGVGKSHYQPPAAYADAFCKAVEDAIGRHCWVYGGNVPREQLVHATTPMLEAFAARPIWFSQYGNFNGALLPRPWLPNKYPQLWQDDGDKYGPGPHRIPGITTLCDNSTVVGPMTVAKLASAWGLISVPGLRVADGGSAWQALVADPADGGRS